MNLGSDFPRKVGFTTDFVILLDSLVCSNTEMTLKHSFQ